MTLDPARQKSILRQVLLWNLALFAGLGVAGWMADSSALLANAIDNGSDAAVYLLSYLAIDRRPAWKRGAAAVSGVMLLLFAVAVMADVVRRWLYGAEPLGPVMMGLALVAAAINLVPGLLRRMRSDDVNMKAAETGFNDFISNGGVIVAGALVLWLSSPWPDLVAGALIAAVASSAASKSCATSAKRRRPDEAAMARNPPYRGIVWTTARRPSRTGQP
ncbi:MAG: cation transporter [Lysobacteraceae bacterium]